MWASMAVDVGPHESQVQLLLEIKVGGATVPGKTVFGHLEL